MCGSRIMRLARKNACFSIVWPAWEWLCLRLDCTDWKTLREFTCFKFFSYFRTSGQYVGLGAGTGLQMRVKEFRNKNVRVASTCSRQMRLEPLRTPLPSHTAIKPCKLITWKIWENRALSTAARDRYRPVSHVKLLGFFAFRTAVVAAVILGSLRLRLFIAG